MNTLKDKKGFTLIELLAVIVILAIVTVIATQTILPYMTNAGRDAFATEFNSLKGTASDVVQLISIGSIKDNYTKGTDTSGNTVYCFTLDNLKELGIWEKDDDSYAGRVLVTAPSGSKKYTYSVIMHSGDYFAESTTGTVKNEDVKDYSESEHGSKVYDCSSIK